jgi:class 3 adenylate cyclase
MPDLPSGTVTFLFTDIEGSTALWERDQVARVRPVTRHLRRRRWSPLWDVRVLGCFPLR